MNRCRRQDPDPRPGEYGSVGRDPAGRDRIPRRQAVILTRCQPVSMLPSPVDTRSAP